MHVQENTCWLALIWGVGGIVHLHCLAWSEGYGRYDTIDGQPPSEGTRGQALRLARRHNQVLAEWNMRKAETWDTTGDFDEEHTEMLTELADTDEDSFNGWAGGADNLREEDAAVLANLESRLDDSA